MNGGILLSFAVVFQTHFLFIISKIRREVKMMLEAPNYASWWLSLFPARLPGLVTRSLFIASGISEERFPWPLLSMPETPDHFPARARKTTIHSLLHHPSRTFFWRVTNVTF
jgi:hypothetical protein